MATMPAVGKSGHWLILLHPTFPQQTRWVPVCRRAFNASLLRNPCQRHQHVRFYASKQSKAPPYRVQPQQISKHAPPSVANPAPVKYYASYAEHLAAKKSSTLLYKAPDSPTLPLASYTFGAFALSYGFWHFYDAFVIPHPGLWWPVPYLMGGVCLFMVGLGLRTGRTGFRLVRSITAYPVSRQALSGQQSTAKTLQIGIEPRTLVPFRRPKVIMMPVEDITLGEGIAAAREGGMAGENPRVAATEASRRRQRYEESKAKEEAHKDHLWNPLGGLFRGIYKAVSLPMIGLRRAAMREGLTNLYIKKAGKKRPRVWRLDVQEGWLAEEGLALQRLIRTR